MIDSGWQIGPIVFTAPTLLWGLLGLGILMWILYRQTKQGVYLPSLKNSIFSSSRKIQSIVFLGYFLTGVIYVFFILLLADPHWINHRETRVAEGIDIVIVFDISLSMLAEDVTPNRIEGGKKVLEEFVSHMQDNRVGIVIFAGKPYILSPLTLDQGYLTQSISSIGTDMINQSISGLDGTAMGDGILLASQMLEKVADGTRGQTIILVTDGEANRGIRPDLATTYAAEKNIIVHTIGIGTPEGVVLTVTRPDGSKSTFRDQSGNPLMVRIDEQQLQDISTRGGGLYFRAQDLEGLQDIFDQLAKLNTSEVVFEQITTLVPAYTPFVYVLFSCFGVFFLCSFLYPILE